jgi:hypothetical protein
MKCKHGMPSPDTCAICKDWPSFEKMHNLFPELSKDAFLVMTPAERLRAVKTGVLSQ